MRKYMRSSKPLCEQKAELRKCKREELAALSDAYMAESDADISQKLLSLPEYLAAKRVFAYCSVGREVSTAKIIEHTLRCGKQLALPICSGNGQMHFALVGSTEELTTGRYGIPEPPAGSQAVTPQEDDILLVPALCADRLGDRLGHGAGYYDRYLANTSCFSVCLCREKLLEDRLPAEATDVRVSLVLTDK